MLEEMLAQSSLVVMSSVSTPPSFRFTCAIWYSLSKSPSGRSPRMTACASTSFAQSTSSPPCAMTRTLGSSRQAVSSSSTRIGTERKPLGYINKEIAG